MTELQSRTTDDQPVPNGGRAEEVTAGVAEQTRRAVVDTAATAQEGLRNIPVPAVDLLQRWTGMVVGIPFTLLAGDRDALLSGKTWVDGTFEIAQGMSAAQRQYVDDVLAVQRHVVGQFVDSTWTFATACRAARPTGLHDRAGG